MVTVYMQYKNRPTQYIFWPSSSSVKFERGPYRFLQAVCTVQNANMATINICGKRTTLELQSVSALTLINVLVLLL